MIHREDSIAGDDGFTGLSLSVALANPALRVYESLGFRKVGASGTSWTMLLPPVETGRDVV